MADNDTSTSTPPASPLPPEKTYNLEELKTFIVETVQSIVGKNDKSGDKSDEKVDIGALVQGEISKIKTREEEKASREQAFNEKVTAAVKKALPEKQPVERRPVHKIMGWGD